MSLKMNLEKGAESLKMNLAKKGVNTPPEAEVAFILDVSGSFHGAHTSGKTQKLLERLVPWAMVFDPDKKLDVFTFADGPTRAAHIGELTLDNVEDYIEDEIVDRAPGYGGGTDYSYVLEEALKNFGWLKEGGFLNAIFGGGQKEKRRSIVLFVTDGENSDEDRCRKILKDSERRGDQIYFLFIGIGHGFAFLNQIADEFSNTGLVVVKDMKKFVEQDDDALNDTLVGNEDGELIKWLKN